MLQATVLLLLTNSSSPVIHRIPATIMNRTSSAPIFSRSWSLKEQLSLLHAVTEYRPAQTIAIGLRLLYTESPERSVDSVRWKIRKLREIYGLGEAGDIDIPSAKLALQRELDLHNLEEDNIRLRYRECSMFLGPLFLRTDETSA